MQRGRTGRGDGIVDALDLVGGGEVGRDRRGHAFRHRERSDPLGRSGRQHGLVRGQHGAGRRPARTRHQPGARMRDQIVAQARIGNRLAHRDIGIGRARPHEAERALVHMLFHIQVDGTRDLAAKAMLDHRLVGPDPRPPGLERGQNLGGVVANAGDDPQPGDDDTTHVASYVASRLVIDSTAQRRNRIETLGAAAALENRDLAPWFRSPRCADITLPEDCSGTTDRGNRPSDTVHKTASFFGAVPDSKPCRVRAVFPDPPKSGSLSYLGAKQSACIT